MQQLNEGSVGEKGGIEREENERKKIESERRLRKGEA